MTGVIERRDTLGIASKVPKVGFPRRPGWTTIGVSGGFVRRSRDDGMAREMSERDDQAHEKHDEVVNTLLDLASMHHAFDRYKDWLFEQRVKWRKDL